MSEQGRLRVYVAGASSEIERAERMIAKLIEAGIAVTSSWPSVIRKVGSANPMGAPREARDAWARTDLDELDASNVYWLLLPVVPSAGAYTELGYATMKMRALDMAATAGVDVPPFEMICTGVETSIFTAGSQHFETDDEGLGYLIATKVFVDGLGVDGHWDDHDDDDEDDAPIGHVVDHVDDGVMAYTTISFKPPRQSLTPLEQQLDAIFKKPDTGT